jgi:hypothetical protein
MLSTGCRWSALPKNLPPKSAARDYFSRWESEGASERIRRALEIAVHEHAGRAANPTTAIIDNQAAKAARWGALRSIRPAQKRARQTSCACATYRTTPSACRSPHGDHPSRNRAGPRRRQAFGQITEETNSNRACPLWAQREPAPAVQIELP